MSGKLELKHGADGLFHTLQRRRVTDGDPLELLLDDMSWVRGRYRWSGDLGDPPRLRLALPGDGGAEAIAVLPPQAILRWPDKTPEHRFHRDHAPTVCGSDEEEA